MRKDDEKKKGITESFVMGVIALVFLLTGYQTALFVHRAAVTRIAASRDSPDTVYIYKEGAVAAAVEVTGSAAPVRIAERVVHKSSEHPPRVEAVRRNLPFKEAESFTFDPNTASVEDFCRLGFTVKQAESIDNYRKKGGRFRRKSDFAKSYSSSGSESGGLCSFRCASRYWLLVRGPNAGAQRCLGRLFLYRTADGYKEFRQGEV